MKKLFLIFTVLCFSFGFSSCGYNIPARPEKIQGPKHSFKPEKSVHWALANGLQVFFIENPELPKISGTLYFPGGTLYEPNGKAGLVSATGSAMREGSIPGLSPEALDKKLDFLGASIETSFGEEFGSASFFSLSEDFEEVFGLLSKIVISPAFDESRFTLWKNLSLEGIRRRRDDRDTMAEMSFTKILYGENSPLARFPSIASISALQTADLRSFHKMFVRPNGAILAISGNLPLSQIKASIEKHFGGWKKNETPLPEIRYADYTYTPGVYVLTRDFDQASIIIGHEGPARKTKDEYAIGIFNRIFGFSGFSSILNLEVRSKRGLAYDVGGGFLAGRDTGQFKISLGTKAKDIDKPITTVWSLVKEVAQKMPEEEMFKNAKEAVKHSFIFKFAKKDSLVQREALIQLYDYPQDFDEMYLDNVEAVTMNDVLEVGKQRIRPEQAITVIVSKLSAQEVKQALPKGTKVFALDFDTEPRITGEL